MAKKISGVEELLKKESSAARDLTGVWHWIASILSVGLVIFYFYGAAIQPFGPEYHRGIYVLITFILVFLFYPRIPKNKRSSKKEWIAFGLAAAVILIGFVVATVEFVNVSGWSSFMELETDETAEFWVEIIVGSFILLLLFPALGSRGTNLPTIRDTLFVLVSIGVVTYWIVQYKYLNERAGAENNVDFLIGVVGVLLGIEVTRRVIGWAMVLVSLCLLGFAYFGPYFPETIQHGGFSVKEIAVELFISTNGVFGIMANVLATYVILFIFFGAFLHKSGVGKFFIDLPLALAGNTVGGPAKVAVMASALFGSVSGSAIANTVSTGTFTIPMMKKAGFKPHVAGAIEPSASIGGMFLPPIMGAGGFIMAELLEKPYSYIMAVAIFPALLYFFSVFAMIHFEAKKNNIRGIKGDEVLSIKEVLRTGWYKSIPLIVITVLMIMGYSPGYAAFFATVSCIPISWLDRNVSMGPKEIWQAMLIGGKQTLIIGATVGTIGIIVGTIELTGIGLQFSNLVIKIAGDNVLLAVIFTAIASLILGMGVPVTAAYLITIVLAAPPLQQMGVSLIAAHMIVYWFSQDSNITPPVCIAAYAGAAIAGADPWKTGWTSFKYAKMLYVMPVMFAFVPATLLDGTVYEICLVFISCFLGTIAFAAITQCYLYRRTNLIEWGLLVITTFLFFWPTLQSTLIGLVLLAAVWFWQKRPVAEVAL